MRISLSALARFGLIPALLIAIPVGGIGGWAVFEAYTRYADGAAMQEVIVWGGIGGLFLLGAISMVARAWKLRKKRQIREKLKDEPWRINPRWRSKSISANRDVSFGTIVFAVVFNLFAWAIAAFVLYQSLTSPDPEYSALLVLLFPAAGALLGWKVAHAFKHRRAFGDTSLQLDSMPVPLGGYLTGVLKTGVKRRDALEDGFTIRLSCYRRVVTSERRKNSQGKGSSTKKKVRMRLLWQDEKQMRGRLSDNGAHLAVPVAFKLPPDLPASDPETRSSKRPVFSNPLGRSRRTSSQIIWRIEVSSPTAVMNYAATVDIPVFEAEVERDVDLEMRIAEAAEQEIPIEGPTSPGIEMKRLPSGGLQFSFDSTRHRSSALILIAMTVMTAAGGIGLWWVEDAPGYVSPLILATAALFGWMAYQKWTEAGEVTVKNGEITVNTGGKPTVIPAAELQEIKVDISGTTSKGSRAEASFAIHAVRDTNEAAERGQAVEEFASMFGGHNIDLGDGDSLADKMKNNTTEAMNTVTIATGLGKLEADWIAQQINDALQ